MTVTTTNDPAQILAYLQDDLPDYPFDPSVDRPFVDELLDDFPDIPLLEEIKAFRWYYDNDPASRRNNLRLAIRRWIANAWTRRSW